MTILSGIIPLSNAPLDTELAREFANTVNQLVNHPDNTTSYTFQNSLVIQTDIRVFETQFKKSRNNNSMAFVAGEPFLSAPYQGISDDLTVLAEQESKIKESLKHCRGTFSGLVCNDSTGEISLFTDKIGVRPLFYCIHNNHLYFSSLFNALKSVLFEHLTLSADGLSEELAFGFSFDDKTPFTQIKRLVGATYLTVTKGSVTVQPYFDWSSIQTNSNANENSYKSLFEKFEQAIELRLKGNQVDYSFLSGGMDSRAVTSIVRKNGHALKSFNFQTKPCQDTEFAKQYAKLANIDLSDVLIEPEDFHGWSRLISREIEKDTGNKTGSYVWSGDGGAPFGGVFLSKTILSQCKPSKYKGMESFFSENKKQFPESYFSKDLRNKLSDSLELRAVKSVSDYKCDAQEHIILHFLVKNGQAKLLQKHHETIHEHQVELALPFFDAEFMAMVYSIPTHELLYHNAYAAWFTHFPEFTRQTPWQTYPGHVPCPVASNSELQDQWKMKKSQKRSQLLEASMIGKPVFQTDLTRVISASYLILKTLTHALGLSKNDFLINYNSKVKAVLSK